MASVNTVVLPGNDSCKVSVYSLQSRLLKKNQHLEELEKRRLKRIKENLQIWYACQSDRKRQREEKRIIRAKIKSAHRKHRKSTRQEVLQHIFDFLANPLAKQDLTPYEREQLRQKKHWRRERRSARRKKLIKFIKNPLQTLFPPKWSAREVGYIPHQTKRDRKIAASKRHKELWRTSGSFFLLRISEWNLSLFSCNLQLIMSLRFY